LERQVLDLKKKQVENRVSPFEKVELEEFTTKLVELKAKEKYWMDMIKNITNQNVNGNFILI